MNLLELLLAMVNTLGISLDAFFLIFCWLLFVVISAIDIRISALLNVVFNAIVFVVIYYIGYDYSLVLMSLFASITILAISFLISLRAKQQII